MFVVEWGPVGFSEMKKWAGELDLNKGKNILKKSGFAPIFLNILVGYAHKVYTDFFSLWFITTPRAHVLFIRITTWVVKQTWNHRITLFCREMIWSF